MNYFFHGFSNLLESIDFDWKIYESCLSMFKRTWGMFNPITSETTCSDPCLYCAVTRLRYLRSLGIIACNSFRLNQALKLRDDEFFFREFLNRIGSKFDIGCLMFGMDRVECYVAFVGKIYDGNGGC